MKLQFSATKVFTFYLPIISASLDQHRRPPCKRPWWQFEESHRAESRGRGFVRDASLEPRVCRTQQKHDEEQHCASLRQWCPCQVL